MFGKFGGWEILIIVLVLVLLFGTKKIPDLMKGVGTGIKDFKKAIKEDETPTTNNKEQNNTSQS